MGLFDKFPFSNAHELNLDWILRQLKDLLRRVKILEQSGGGGTSDYNDLSNKPSINSITLSGNKTASDLGLGTYSKPSGGIPKTDLASSVQTSLGKADTALQSAPVTSVDGKTGTVNILPAGGTTGQVLKKSSNDNYLVEWANESGGGSTEIYWVTYGSTTYSEIRDALLANKVLFCNYNNLVYRFTQMAALAHEGEYEFIFTAPEEDGTINWIKYNMATSAWSEGSTRGAGTYERIIIAGVTEEVSSVSVEFDATVRQKILDAKEILIVDYFVPTTDTTKTSKGKLTQRIGLSASYGVFLRPDYLTGNIVPAYGQSNNMPRIVHYQKAGPLNWYPNRGNSQPYISHTGYSNSNNPNIATSTSWSWEESGANYRDTMDHFVVETDTLFGVGSSFRVYVR